MQGSLFSRRSSEPIRVVSPMRELGAYEALWARPGMSVKKLAQLFRENPGALPSDLVEATVAGEMGERVLEMLRERGVSRFGISINNAGDYPRKLRDAKSPLEVLYFQGWWSLTESPSVAVVGTREPSPEGILRARKVAEQLVQDGKTVVSGLATGIDTAAHTAAIQAGGRTIAVIGTPLGEFYPKGNRALQEEIASRFLVVSQVPVYRHSLGHPLVNKYFFPERNVTMSALTEATVIVEAGETSGTLYQARAAIAQKRKLFIMDSCFQRGLKWPEKYSALGAIRVRSYDDIRRGLSSDPPRD